MTQPDTPTAEEALDKWLTKLQRMLMMSLLGNELVNIAAREESDMLATAAYFTAACIVAAGEHPEWAHGVATLSRQFSDELGGNAVFDLADKIVRSLPIEVQS